jgi:hypothetical protein
VNCTARGGRHCPLQKTTIKNNNKIKEKGFL